jgi:hypothetical protein
MAGRGLGEPFGATERTDAWWLQPLAQGVARAEALRRELVKRKESFVFETIPPTSQSWAASTRTNTASMYC